MLAERIRELLVANNKSASDLARFVDVTPQAAAKWLAGSEPRPKVKEKIARFFSLTPQELEYGNHLSQGAPRPEAAKANATLSKAIAQHTANSMIEQELRNVGPKSEQYVTGMRDLLMFRLSGIHSVAPFKPGTCECDAYEAGYSHGRVLIDTME